jgi:hypothetical protein
MRRFFFSLLVVSTLTGMMGCHCNHIAGVCDCQPEPPPCAHRAPYLQVSYPIPMGMTPATPLVNSPMQITEPIPQVKDAK